ncbi:Uu.00g005860.m01.CDS01 [Anthostomella pinea]|uniref:Uu.00g005860.m01.CDS01 n=1 Tax=Anthostomella pinea TaxID=933095 RepID=A0AAI8VK80_9PEZI|nr:Uu.00g005860.m01.CDS01 [Anthostomella pinea]
MVAFDRNFTFYIVPAAFILLFLLKLYSFALGGRYLDPASPQKYKPAIADADDLDPKTKARILRAESAFANGLETISLYAAAVVSVNIAAVNPVVANALAIAYLGTRVIYNVIYVVLQDEPRWALARSATWFTGVGIILTMFLLAGSAVY